MSMCLINFGFNGVLLQGDVTAGQRGSRKLWPACVAWVGQTIGQHCRSDSNLTQVLSASFCHFWLMDKVCITLKVRKTLLINSKILPCSQLGKGWEILGLFFLKSERLGTWTALLRFSGRWPNTWEQSQAETHTRTVPRMKLSCFQRACREDLLLSPDGLS